MKSLSTLIKLQKTRVDEQRQFLALLQDKLVAIENDIARLEVEKAREQIAAETHHEARSSYGAYLKVAIEKGRLLENERVAAVVAVEAGRDRLVELFEEQKRYETAEASYREAEAREGRRQETLELDEIGSVQFTRKKE